MDAELVQLVCLDEWPDCRLEVVADRASYQRELERGGHDLILSDFNLIRFNGLDALQLARAKCPAVPFIFISGTIGEERAIEALRSGASDYVIKDRPKRLVPAMKRALEAAQHVRERRAAEEQLLRVQRLENIGMLASGIAHDFNNVLAPVLMAVPLLRDQLGSARDQRILDSVESSVQRGAGLVRQILGFAHGVTGEPQLMQPKHLIRDLIGVMQQTFPRSITIEDETEGGLWPLKVNPTQLHQVLLNLCVNARDAMPEGGTLTLYACNRELDELSSAAIPGTRPGPWLLLEVKDTGIGIPPEVQQRIWEPFFTTKEAGRGTGLGLSTVRGIVESYRGAVLLQSQVGAGTTFQVFLPATPGVELHHAIATSVALPRGHGELILVVDDDTNVRDITSAILVRQGYRVIAAQDGTEAIALFAPRTLEIKLVVTDLSMPNLDGIALSRIIRSLNPSVRILAISGLADEKDRLRRQPGASNAFLAKPFTADTLLVAVSDLLRTGETARAVVAAASA